MSKKRFTSGLDSIFSTEAMREPNIDDSPWLLETAVAEPVKRSAKKSKTANKELSRTARKAGKSFTSDLESLFASASEVERPREAKHEVDETTRSRNRPRRRVAAYSGIDGLIRDTTDGKAAAKFQEQESGVRKRVTFTYDREHFAKLKAIARQEGNYLKDIISSLLTEYIVNYEMENGSK